MMVALYSSFVLQTATNLSDIDTARAGEKRQQRLPAHAWNAPKLIAKRL